jgi:integrase
MGRGEGLFFGRRAETPFDDSSLAGRAATAWKNAELQGITLHQARHTCASLMIAAGVNAKSLQTYMGLAP